MSDNNNTMRIIVDDGSRRVPIENLEGKEIGFFTFHPTDLGIIERFNAMAERFDSVVEPLAALEANGEELDIFAPQNVDAVNAARDRLFAEVNTLLGSDDAAEAFFGSMHPFSPVDGDFYCNQVLALLGDYIGKQFSRETKAMSKKAKKYLKK